MDNERFQKAVDKALAALRQRDAKLIRQNGGGASAGFYLLVPHNSFRVREEVAAKLLERNDVQPLDLGLTGVGGPQSWIRRSGP